MPKGKWSKPVCPGTNRLPTEVISVGKTWGRNHAGYGGRAICPDCKRNVGTKPATGRIVRHLPGTRKATMLVQVGWRSRQTGEFCDCSPVERSPHAGSEAVFVVRDRPTA